MLVFLAAIESDSDKDKFERVYEAYRQVMFYVANSILHDPALAEDAVQQAFLRVLNHLDNISDPECPQTKSFVVIIVRNIAINLYNSRRKRTVLSFDELEDWTADASGSPVSTAEDKDGFDRLVGLIRRLPEGYRDVLLLKFGNGYSTAEVASMLNLTEENVKKRLQRARKKLEQLLEKEGVER